MFLKNTKSAGASRTTSNQSNRYVPHMQLKSCDQSLYVLSLYDRVQPVVYGSAKNERGNRDQTWTACQKNMTANVFIVLLIALAKKIIKSADKESEYYLQCVR